MNTSDELMCNAIAHVFLNGRFTCECGELDYREAMAEIFDAREGV